MTITVTAVVGHSQAPRDRLERRDKLGVEQPPALEQPDRRHGELGVEQREGLPVQRNRHRDVLTG